MMNNVCRICGSLDYKDCLKFEDKGREIVICAGCNTHRTLPFVETDYREHEFYCEHYLRNEELFKGFTRAFVEVVLRHKNRGRFLDIGCAVGFLLEEARNAGFEVEGIELNKKAAEIVRAKGFDVKTCSIGENSYRENIFDVVTLNHILEHIIELNKFLQDIKRILKKDGILVIGVPNHSSLIAKLYTTRWYGWGIPEHIWHFDRRSMNFLLSKNSFKVKELIQNSQYYAFSKSLKKNIMAMIACFGNAIGRGDQLIVVAEKK